MVLSVKIWTVSYRPDDTDARLYWTGEAYDYTPDERKARGFPSKSQAQHAASRLRRAGRRGEVTWR